MIRSWAFCPNDPPCPHAAVLHDFESFDHPAQRCCVEGCECGRAADTSMVRPITPSAP